MKVKKINAPIRYFGGKGTMFNEIIGYFPKAETYKTYIEPFGGSYAVGLHMPYLPPVEIYNDMDKNVYALYRVLQDEGKFEKFKNLCDVSIYSEEMRREYKKELKKPYEEVDEVMRAFMFFYINRTSRNGIGGFSINTIVRRGMSKSVSDMLSAIERLPELHERLSRVIVTNQDGLGLIERYGRKDVFMYCDPPYHWSTRTSTRYDVDMDDETQVKFIETCIASKAKLLISGYDNELYHRLEENGFHKVEFTVHTVDGTAKSKDKVECLWYNYELDIPQDENELVLT